MSPLKAQFRSSSLSFILFLIILGDFLHVIMAQDFAGIARSARAEAEMEVGRRNTASRVRTPMRRPSVRFAPPMTAFGAAAGVGGRPRRTLSPAAKLRKVHGSRSVPRAFRDAARVFQLSSNIFQRRTSGFSGSPAAAAGFRSALAGICPLIPPCDPFAPYRTPDGTCNNLFFPLQGSQSTPQPRFLFAAYEDFVDVPRQHGVLGLPLPSARFVSNHVHRNPGPEILEAGITLFLMQWGQFTDHDVVITPILEEADGEAIDCCPGGVPGPPREECFPIVIPQPGDPYFPPAITCMNFVRSTPAISSGCIPGQRQQLNLLTSYIDASNVYGSTRERQEILRLFVGGLLKEEFRNLPRDPIDQDCDLRKPDPNPDYCMIAGDERVLEQPSLSMIHTVFMREHNRIAAALAAVQPTWDDETLFQQARKIVAAEMQHITYNEYLPKIIGPAHMSFFGLYSAPAGFSFVYSPSIDASIVNVFAAASYRYGHSQVPNVIAKNVVVGGASILFRDLDDTFFQPNMVLKQPFGVGADWLARYTATANSLRVDSFIAPSIRDKLFKDALNVFDSLDLAALNIQRGRDHGLPPYNAYRVLCGRAPYLDWAGAVDHTPVDVAKLQAAYSDPRDIDMFTGALSEIPVPGGLVGPTNACILGNQFYRLKRGDRFFYENPFITTGFTLDQLNNIKASSTLARIMCRNTFTALVQPRLFHKVSAGNPLVDCASLPDLDLGLWSGPLPFAGRHGNGFHGPIMSPPASPLSAFKFQKHPKFLVPKFPPGFKGKGKPLPPKKQ